MDQFAIPTKKNRLLIALFLGLSTFASFLLGQGTSMEKAIEDYIDDDTFSIDRKPLEAAQNAPEFKRKLEKRLERARTGNEFYKIGRLAQMLEEAEFEKKVWRAGVERMTEEALDPWSEGVIVESFLIKNLRIKGTFI